MKTIGSWVLWALVAAPVRADVLTVDDDGGARFTSLSAAVAAAQDGDVVLVAPGLYIEPEPVVVDDLGLSIIGDGPAWAIELWGGLVVRDLSPGRPVVVQNLEIVGAWSNLGSPAGPGLALENCVSLVRVEGVLLSGGSGLDNAYPDGGPGVTITGCDSVAFVSALIEGGDGQDAYFDSFLVPGSGGHGLAGDTGAVVITQSEVRAGSAGDDALDGVMFGGVGGHGIVKSGGRLVLASTHVEAGDGGSAKEGGDGGHALALIAPAQAELFAGVSLTAGHGAPSGNGPPGVDGLEIVGDGTSTDYGGTSRAFDVTTPLREGEAGLLDVTGLESVPKWLFVSAAPHLVVKAGYEGVIMVAPPFAAPIVLPPGDVPFVVPELGPGIDALEVFMQPVYFEPTGTTLGSGRMVLLLDAGL